jgi:hypothetical protein
MRSRPPGDGLSKNPRRHGSAKPLIFGIGWSSMRSGALAPAIRKYCEKKSQRNLDGHLAYVPHLDGDEVLAVLNADARVWRNIFTNLTNLSSFAILPLSRRR